MNQNNTKPGPIHDRIHKTLLPYPFYQDFLAGKLDRHQYADQLLALEKNGLPDGIAAGDFPFASRFPANTAQFVRNVLEDLHIRGWLPSSNYDEAGYSAYEQKTENHFWHGNQATYIAAEEARLVYALCNILQPQKVAFLGSYYGYWAHWALPNIQAAGGRAWLVDIDADVSAIAQKNIDQFGFGDKAEVVVEDAIAFCQSSPENFDMVVIDAECPCDHPNPSYRGKAVYLPILQAVLPKMAPGSALVFHNIIFRHFHKSAFFDSVMSRNRQELDSLLSLLEERTKVFLEYESTEGVGIGFLPR
ncbi:MAG: hypothetical protein F6J93_21870 [Oscillatoria sp. SIO1A7]|nr:hypothetical protein [Oscillatoria sp. SIO1A7]